MIRDKHVSKGLIVWAPHEARNNSWTHPDVEAYHIQPVDA